jgi:methyl-accepting chemotaxis protein
MENYIIEIVKRHNTLSKGSIEEIQGGVVGRVYRISNVDASSWILKLNKEEKQEEKDVDEIQEDVENIEKDVDEIAVDIDEIQEDVQEIEADVEELAEESEEDIATANNLTLVNIQKTLASLSEEIERLKTKQ